MWWWSSRLQRDTRAAGDGVDFVELVATEVPSDEAIEIVLANGRRVRVRAGFDVVVLRAVVRALEST